MRVFRLFTVRGDKIEDGIAFDRGRLIFRPRWGMQRNGEVIMAVVDRPCEHLRRCRVAIHDGFPVLVPVAPCRPDMELVLLQEYSNGCGAKRYPSFYVTIGDSERVLRTESTSGGSGYERWSLLLAPMGWSANISGQFVNRRDVESQKITYTGCLNT